MGLVLGPVVLSVFYELVVAWTRLESVPADAMLLAPEPSVGA